MLDLAAGNIALQDDVEGRCNLPQCHVHICGVRRAPLSSAVDSQQVLERVVSDKLRAGTPRVRDTVRHAAGYETGAAL